MCDMTNGCDCEKVFEAYSTDKRVEFFNPDTDEYVYAEWRLVVNVCASCGAPDWRTIC